MGYRGRINELVLYVVVNYLRSPARLPSLTGTFFCEMTTAQSLPRTPNDVMFAAVIALNAYSV